MPRRTRRRATKTDTKECPSCNAIVDPGVMECPICGANIDTGAPAPKVEEPAVEAPRARAPDPEPRFFS